jgi:hypothetical protein
VLHGRVFGRAPLARETVLAAFADGARVRAELLLRLADAAGGEPLADELRALLARHPARAEGDDDEAATRRLRDAYAAQEDAALRIAAHLDATQG